MIKAVLFDYGGVLTEGGKVGGIQQVLGKIYGLAPEKIEMADLHREFICGQIDAEQFFGELNKRYATTAQATRAIFDTEDEAFFTRSAPVYELAARLRQAGLKTGILSNVYPTSAERLRQRGFYDGFDPVVLSFEAHVCKPDPAFFQLALQNLGLPGEQVLFVDDQERFREVTESLGMRFVRADSPEQIVRDVEAATGLAA